MKIMKKRALALLAVTASVIALSFTGCGNTTQETTKAETTTAETTTKAPETTTKAPETTTAAPETTKAPETTTAAPETEAEYSDDANYVEEYYEEEYYEEPAYQGGGDPCVEDELFY